MKVRYAAIEVDRAPTPPRRREERLQQALMAHQSGFFPQADALYAELLTENPSDPQVLFLAGTLRLQAGDSATAVAMLEGASALLPSQTSVWENLGSAYLGQNRHEEALQALLRATHLDPNSASAHYNLGNIQSQRGDLPAAVSAYQRSVELDPTQPAAWFNLANTLMSLEQPAPAVEAYGKVQAINAHFPNLKNNRAHALFAAGRETEAIAVWQALVTANPGDVQSVTNLGVALLKQGRDESATQWFQDAVAKQPHSAPLWALLGTAAYRAEQLHVAADAFAQAQRLDPTQHDYRRDAAICQVQIRNFDRAIEPLTEYVALKPDDASARRSLVQALYFTGDLGPAIDHQRHILKSEAVNAKDLHYLGVLLREAGDADAALKAFEYAATTDPDDGLIESDVLLTMAYLEEVSGEQLRARTEEWAARHSPSLPSVAFHPRSAGPLRIGLLSADFHSHPAGYLYSGLFPQHNRDEVELCLYVNQNFGDELSVRILESADRYSFVKDLSDADLTDKIRAEKIDILVDLLGHTPNHRLPVFGRRAAPVQMSFLGYFATTGVASMDYILADEWLIPADHRSQYTEDVAYIEGGSLYAYQVPTVDISPNPAPILATGNITFGCFNNLIKINSASVALWAEVLRQNPESRLKLVRLGLRSDLARERIYQFFDREGIARDRVELSATRTRQEYFEAYHGVDVMLDTTPFGAGTTTSDALWMGVPVVSMTGDRFGGRMTASIYNAVGVPELLAQDREEYLALARGYASDPDLVQELRSSLRNKLETSPMCDLADYARRLEATYRRLANR